MKKLLLILLMSIFLLVGSTSVAKEEKKVNYKVTIEVTYNAVSVEEATKIHNEIIHKHKNACKCRVVTSKIGDLFRCVDADVVSFSPIN